MVRIEPGRGEAGRVEETPSETSEQEADLVREPGLRDLESTRVRRSRFLSFAIEDQQKLDLSAFLRGEVAMRESSHLVAFSAVSGERFSLEPADIAGLLSIPTTQWTPACEVLDARFLTAERLVTLIEAGALVSDAVGPATERLRERDAAMDRLQWSPTAALYHFATQREEAERPSEPIDIESLSDNAEENARKVVDLRGAPPPAAQSRRGELEALPPGDAGSGRPFYEVLRSRRTVRGFDRDAVMSRQHLATLLRWVFGAHGQVRLAPEVELLHKTSPSGGSLHPIDVYPLVLRVEGVEPGLYHYDLRHHGLRSVEPLDREAAQDLAVRVCRNQLYAGDAQVLFVLTARWGRNFWKYRKSSRTYTVILKDAGHLSQTFYLTAAELGLGAFYTGAIRSEPLEQALGLRVEEEAPLGICGCGAPSPKGELGLPFETFEPAS